MKIIPVIVIAYLTALSCTIQVKSEVPQFIIDFDKDPSIRYNEVFTHFKSGIAKMEHLFFYSVMPQYRDYFKTNEELFKKVNPHAYYAMKSLAEIVGIETP